MAVPEIGALNFRFGAYRFDRIGGDDAAVDQHRQFIGEAEDRVHVVLDQQDGLVALEPFRNSTMRAPSSLPMPAMGSSSNSMRGCIAGAIATSSWRCSPCETLAATRSARSSSPTWARAHHGRVAQRRSFLTGAQKRNEWPLPALHREHDVFQQRHRQHDAGNLERAREALARAPRHAQPTMLCPPNSMLAAVGRSWPDSCASSVVLPAPLGPMIAWICPVRSRD